MGRRAAKVDRNQAEIVKALRQAGATVAPSHTMGQGFPDLVVGYRGRTYLIEVKDGLLPPSARALNDLQECWHGQWRGQVAIANNVTEALAVIGISTIESIQHRGTVS